LKLQATCEGRAGWRHKASAGAHRVIAYPPQHKQIDSSFGGLAILILSQDEIL